MPLHRIVIRLPHPHPLLSPNERPTRYEKNRAKNGDMDTAFVHARNALKRHDPPYWSRAYLHIDWPFDHDLDNAIAMLKASIDGITKAGILTNDRNIACISITRSQGDEAILTFTEAGHFVSHIDPG